MGSDGEPVHRFAVPGGRDASLLLLARVSMSSQRALVGVVTTIYLAKLGFSAFKLAVLFALVAVCSTLMSAGIGTVADRIGRKPFLVALPLITAGCGLVFAVTDNMVALFVAASLGSSAAAAGPAAARSARTRRPNRRC